MAGKSCLTLKDVNAYYGKTQILRNVSMNVKEGEIVCLVGRIGAGKTTCFRAIMGLIPRTGYIDFLGKNLVGKQPYEIARMGIGYAPEGRRLYSELTVEENLKVGTKRSDDKLELIYELFPRLKERRNFKAKFLSGGEKQMLVIAQALIHDPKLLLVDEPFEGLALPVRNKLVEAFQKMKKEKLTVLVAEANLLNVKPIADEIYVIHRGEIVFHGGFKEVEEFRRARPIF